MTLMTIKEGKRPRNEKEGTCFWTDLPGNDLPSSATAINFYTEDMRNLTRDVGFYIKTYNDISLIFKPPKDPPESE